MIYINNTLIPPNAKWLKKAKDLTELMIKATTDAERYEIIEKNHKIWKSLKDALKTMSYGKCWYSEARELYSHYHVDHFRPKKRAFDINNIDRGGYWWLAFDWENYRLMGSVGNTKKGDYFPVKRHKALTYLDPTKDEVYYLLDPSKKDDVKLLNFEETGKAIPTANEKSANWSYLRAKETIDWYDLNYEDLKEERKRIWRTTVDEILETQYLLDEFEVSQSVVTESEILSKYEAFRKLISPCTELSATYRSCLRSSGFDWAQRIIEENIDARLYCREYIT
ncbi:hypothetical protein IR010_02965 [Flavobacterium sp. MR2016-29]|uniref:hypothetical protein n=1 Tax=Flavobacterium sp. MR2016-29 TaxID=2783795 RepID=UPI00188A3E79|nr:hypothetical protein [Flavobacterium sp. MR2016-29]MBF4491486.1 hypothetical protein [Flavobacterium sp. MR2016-29]